MTKDCTNDCLLLAFAETHFARRKFVVFPERGVFNITHCMQVYTLTRSG